LDTPNAQVSSSSNGKTPPPLPVTPPKGSPTKLSPKLPLKIPLKSPAVPPCKPNNGLADQEDNTKAAVESSPSHDGPAQTQSSPKGSPGLSKKVLKKSPVPELNNKDNELEGENTL
jgi:hypothetical protein